MYELTRCVLAESAPGNGMREDHSQCRSSGAISQPGFDDLKDLVVGEARHAAAFLVEVLVGDVANRTHEGGSEVEGELAARLAILDDCAETLHRDLLDPQVELAGTGPGRGLEPVSDAGVRHLGRTAVDHPQREAVPRELQLLQSALAHPISCNRP